MSLSLGPGLGLTLGLSLGLVACAPPRPPAQQASTAPKPVRAALPVVTTFLPITLFTRAVAGDCATVTALIPAHLGPHDFQAQPGDLATLRRARVLVMNGLQMEAFLEPLIRAVANPQLQVIDSSRGIATLPNASSSAHDPSGAHAHDHGVGDAHDHGGVNPHIWLDPLRAVQQVATIRDGLIQADPGCAAGYRRNAAAFTAQLRQLDQEIAATLRPYAGRTFIAFHDFAPYFAQRYRLQAETVVAGPGISPSPKDLQRVSGRVRALRLKGLLSEPQEGNRAFKALASDLGIGLSLFDPLETGSEPASREPATYAQVQRRNGAALRQVFAP